jgi:hypothetical protein
MGRWWMNLGMGRWWMALALVNCAREFVFENLYSGICIVRRVTKPVCMRLKKISIISGYLTY